MAPESLQTAHTEDQSRYSFEEFASQKEYIDVNSQLVNDTLTVEPNAQILDFAGGTGLIAGIAGSIFDGLPTTITVVDPNRVSIQIARKSLPDIGATHMNFIEGSYQSLYREIQPQSIDMAYFCNAIHEIHDPLEQRRILDALYTSLKPGGRLVVNSTFVREWPTERKDIADMGKLKKRSIVKLGQEVEKAETGFISHPTAYYVDRMRASGLTVDESTGIHTRKVSLYAAAVRAIARYDGFILGTFSDMAWANEVSIDDKSNALIATINEMEQEATDRGEVFHFNRNWVEVVATKPGKHDREELPLAA